MKSLNKVAITVLAASVFSGMAFAETGYDKVQTAKGSVEALAVTLENMGQDVDTSVDLNGAYTFEQKAALYDSKHAELQRQFDSLHTQTAE